MRTWRQADGFTLAELLVALAVLGFLLAGTFSILSNGVRAYDWGARRIEAQQSARLALERMAKELRDAGYDPRSTGLAALVVAAPDRVTFQQDLNGNGIVDATRERVTYLLRPGESILRRDAGGGAQPVIEGVRRLRLSYVDRDGAPTTDARRVATIHIALEVGVSGPTTVMETSVSPRNRPVR